MSSKSIVKTGTGERQNRLSHIDAMRGLAALAVTLFHNVAYFLKPITSGSAWFWKFQTDYFDLGKFAVVIFFAISGGVIPFSLSGGKSSPIKRFLVSRFMRLYPAYWVAVLAGFVFVWDGPVTAKLAIGNISMLQSFFNIPNVIEVFWTLQIELIFYGACLVLFRINRLNSPRFLFGAVLLCLSLAFGLAYFRYKLAMKLPVALPLALGVMFLGNLTRMRIDLQTDTPDPRYVTLLYLVLMVPISLLAYNFDFGFDEHWQRYVLSYGVALVLFQVWIRRNAWNPEWLQWFGKISYSLYLLHPVGMSVANRYTGFPMPLKCAFSIALSILASWLIFSWVEAPAIRLGKRIISRIAPNR
jgi:peptidoglycan/LPS O-acetylase OafA/YrhL